MIREPTAVRAAKALVSSEGIRRLPVRIDEIAQKYAHIVFEEMPDDVSGILIPLPDRASGRSWVIAVNAGHAEVRQRFTIAHELGHLVLHKYTSPHADGRLRVRFRDSESSKGRMLEEVQANQFAAELLMPERFVRALTNNSDVADAASDEIAMKQLQTWAERFQVSVQALSLRIANLSAVTF